VFYSFVLCTLLDGGARRVARMCRGVQFPVSMETNGLLHGGGLRRDVAERVWKLLIVIVLSLSLSWPGLSAESSASSVAGC